MDSSRIRFRLGALAFATLVPLGAGCGGGSTGGTPMDAATGQTVDMAQSGPDLAGCTGKETFAAARTAMLSNCSGMGCHSAAPFAGGLDLRAANAHKNLVGVMAQAAPEKLLVKPGDPEGSFLYQKLTNTQDVSEGSPMPGGLAWQEPDGAKLDVLRCWILRGAAND